MRTAQDAGRDAPQATKLPKWVRHIVAQLNSMESTLDLIAGS
ncbi:hypothetical protein N8I84_38815 [Streptomyces cynarae]|uniref:Transposase n=1 Tax=Streptomyces cynarae TaxID=2981134 RepID=A0ABY6EBG9_9ACTN|nr:hypothetical protein N8I84_38815 [Streptomyces cynarae]